ncbi:YdcF family protein [Algibacter sp. L4_22]|uniref:YdcF family protein n=1 Tax=Algibacter sp. L4_22 TaxID=2942477 RepID=UPI00201B8271|nr:YdcF family protein [Algibacter sp. L4_22]MCL5129273.1 YdcF family protein [Algibacter sp. L4_22]
MKKLYLVVFFIGLINIITAQNTTNFNPNFKASVSYSKVQDQNFYLFSAIQSDPELVSILESNEELNTIFNNKKESVSVNLKNEKLEIIPLINAYKFSETEITNISSILSKEVKSNKVLKELITKNLRPSGKYENFKSLKNPEYISAAWELCAKAINQSLSVYGLGEKGRYHTIDSISYNIKEKNYKGALFMWSDMLTHKKESLTNLFFQPSLDYTLALLYMNHRDESARYEPLTTGENKKTIAAITQINFDDFPYSTILILGNGPENNKDVLTALGKLNLQLGVIEYQKKNAPIIIVSGGHAHPFRAPFAEAIEMKKELINRYHIPENRILIDPYARHTTTNLRNASRLIINNEIPLEKLGLVVTNNGHSKYVGEDSFIKRCKEELGYIPAFILKRINSTTLEYQPKIESLHQNPLDPLDP